jgi:hypothetical protein
MSSKRKWLKGGIIVTTLGAILFLHYFTYLTHGPMKYEHAAHRMLFYLPLVLGSFWFGLKGALCVSAAVIVCNLPYAIGSWEGLSPEDFLLCDRQASCRADGESVSMKESLMTQEVLRKELGAFFRNVVVMALRKPSLLARALRIFLRRPEQLGGAHGWRKEAFLSRRS